MKTPSRMLLMFVASLLFSADLLHAQGKLPPERNKAEPAPQGPAPGGIKAKDLFNDSATLDKFKKVMSATDAEYDALRKKIVEVLVNEKLASAGDYAFGDFDLGWNDGQQYIQVQSTRESKNELRVFLYKDRIDVYSLYGGEKFRAAVGEYIKGLTADSGGVELPYLMETFQKERASLALNIKCFEPKHDRNSVIKGTMSAGAHKGQQFAKMLFKQIPGVKNRLPEPGITVDLYGTASFDPKVQLGAPSTAACVAPEYDSMLR